MTETDCNDKLTATWVSGGETKTVCVCVDDYPTFDEALAAFTAEVEKTRKACPPD